MCRSCRTLSTLSAWACWGMGMLTGLLIALFIWLGAGMPSSAAGQSRAESRRIELLARKLEARQAQQRLVEEKRRRAREAEYQWAIEEHGGSSPMMRWTLEMLPHHMREQDGPRAGRFIAPAAGHHTLVAELDAKLRGTGVLPRIAGMMFRGFGKSTYGTTALTLYGALECRRVNIAIICSTKDEAKDRIQNIIHEVENNERLKARYGEAIEPAIDRKKHTVGYTDYQIKLKGKLLPDGTRQIITIKAYEFGKGKIRGRNVGGKRFDLIILDDPEHDDLAYSEILRTRYWAWLQTAVLRSITKYGLIVWLGTPVGENSLLVQARSERSDDNPDGMSWQGPIQPICDRIETPGGDVIEYSELLREKPQQARTLILEVLKRYDKDARCVPGYRLLPHWCQMHDPEDINAMLGEMSPEAAAQEIFLIPRSALSNPWDVAWFLDRTYDANLLHRVGPGVWEYDGKPLSRPIAWIDSAGSTESGADFTAIGVAAKLPSGRGIMLDLRHDHWTLPDQLKELHDLHATYGLAKIYHQKSHFERGISQFAGVDLERTWLPFEPVTMDTTAGAKIRLITESTTPVSNGAMLYSFDERRGKQRRLVTEAKTFPGGKVDALDMHANLIKVLNNPDYGAPGGGKAASTGVKRESVSRDMERF